MTQRRRTRRGQARSLGAVFVMCMAAVNASAQEKPVAGEDPPALAVVVESDGGLKLARRVRTLVSHHLHLQAQSLARFDARPDSRKGRPDVVVAISADPHDELHVVYWDRTGITEGLAVPRPKAFASAALVAASLAVALVRRNLPALQRTLQIDPYYEDSPAFGARRHSALSVLSPRELRRFLNSLGVVSHRTEGLSESDF